MGACVHRGFPLHLVACAPFYSFAPPKWAGVHQSLGNQQGKPLASWRGCAPFPSPVHRSGGGRATGSLGAARLHLSCPAKAVRGGHWGGALLGGGLIIVHLGGVRGRWNSLLPRPCQGAEGRCARALAKGSWCTNILGRLEGAVQGVSGAQGQSGAQK